MKLKKSDKAWIDGYLANDETQIFTSWLREEIKDKRKQTLERFLPKRDGLPIRCVLSGKIQGYDDFLMILGEQNAKV
jgi:hypothetical protein